MHLSPQSILELLAFLAVGLLAAIVGVTWYTIRVLTHPYRRTYASAIARSRPGEPSELPPGPSGPRTFTSWQLNWQGHQVPVWDVPGDNPQGPAIILSHGWGDSRIGGLSRLQPLAVHTSRLILWDMPGHGDAPGICSLGTQEVGALTQLIEQVGQPAVLYGWSLGAGVSIAAAVANPNVLAVIAEAPYCIPATPARNVLRGFGLPYRLNLPLALSLLGVRFGVGSRWKNFDRAALAAQLTQPLLILHGEADEVCPIEDARQIAAAAAHASLAAIPNAGHHGLFTDPRFAPQSQAAIDAFFQHDPALNSPHAHQPHS